jgi:hypothetical protein
VDRWRPREVGPVDEGLDGAAVSRRPGLCDELVDLRLERRRLLLDLGPGGGRGQRLGVLLDCGQRLSLLRRGRCGPGCGDGIGGEREKGPGGGSGRGDASAHLHSPL